MKKFKDGKGIYYKNKWLSFYPQRCDFSIRYYTGGYYTRNHEFNLGLVFFSLYITLPWKGNCDDCDPPGYGIYYHTDAIWFNWNKITKLIPMPWQLQFVRRSLLLADRQTWEHELKGEKGKEFWKDEWLTRAYVMETGYIYILKSGKKQHVNATCTIREMEWRPYWFMWTGLFKKVNKTIEVEFSGEVGESAGSWKGGCIACSYSMLPGEAAIDTLIRMENDRKFN